MLDGQQFRKFSEKTTSFIEQSDNYGQKIFKRRKEAFEKGHYVESLYWKPSEYKEIVKHFKKKPVTTELLKEFYSYVITLNEISHKIVMTSYTLKATECIPQAMINTANLSLSNTIFEAKLKSVRNSVENKNISDSDRKELNVLRKAAR